MLTEQGKIKKTIEITTLKSKPTSSILRIYLWQDIDMLQVFEVVKFKNIQETGLVFLMLS